MFMTPFDRIDYSTDEFVKGYDELPLWSAPFGLLLLGQVPLRTGARILDVGAGAGFLSLELAQRCGGTSEVVAVDPWGAALRRLRDKAARFGVNNVSVIESAVEDADLEAESFDLIVSNLGLNNFADPEAALAACRRALKSDGTLIVSTNTRGHMAEFYDVYHSTLSEVGLGETLAALEKHIDHRPTEASLSALLKEAGFEITGRREGSFAMRFADGSALLRHYFIRLGFLPDWGEVCPHERRDEVFAIVEARLNALAAKSGAVSLRIPMLCIQAVKSRS